MTSNLPLLCYSTTSRANIVEVSKPMPKRNRTKKVSRRKSPAIQVSNGKVTIKIPGYTGLQKVALSHLIKYIPISKIKVAAKRFIRSSKTIRNTFLQYKVSHRKKRTSRKHNPN